MKSLPTLVPIHKVLLSWACIDSVLKGKGSHFSIWGHQSPPRARAWGRWYLSPCDSTLSQPNICFSVVFLQLSSEGLRFWNYSSGEWCHSTDALEEGVQRFKTGWEAISYFISSGKEGSLKGLGGALSILKQTVWAWRQAGTEILPRAWLLCLHQEKCLQRDSSPSAL